MTTPSEAAPTTPDIARGCAALDAGAWEEALAIFERVLTGTEHPVALEGLGEAAWWLHRTAEVFESRERAYRLYRELGDARAAARVAVWLSWDYAAFRGESAVARGWLSLARQLLETDRTSAEYAWLCAREAVVGLFDDPDQSRALALEGAAAAHAAGSRDFELLAHSVEGLAQVSGGAVGAGMERLDGVSAAIIGGEMRERVCIGLAGCYLIAACDRVRDYDRAAQWCTRIKAYSQQWGFRPLSAVCRTQYAAVCLWRGHWDEAERELESAVSELAATRPAMTAESAVRLGELRRRQGRLDEAEALFEQAGALPMATVGRAALALDRGDARAAGDLAERYLRRVNPRNRIERVTALDLLVRARLLDNRTADAEAACQELEDIAREAGTGPLQASALLCRALVSSAAGRLDESRRQCEDAVDLFDRSNASFDGARARLELAAVLTQMGRPEPAIAETRQAVQQFMRMDARLDLARAEVMLEAAGRRGNKPADTAGLTARELDVLRLVAKGLSNPRVAEQLFISEHTVHRHVANTLSKLGVSSRSAAVARAAQLGLLEGA